MTTKYCFFCCFFTGLAIIHFPNKQNYQTYLGTVYQKLKIMLQTIKI